VEGAGARQATVGTHCFGKAAFGGSTGMST
jgi:hypothetical protein